MAVTATDHTIFTMLNARAGNFSAASRRFAPWSFDNPIRERIQGDEA
jgi:hypothetical protein